MSDKPKFGAGVLSAYGRQGLAEIRGALYPESNVAQPTEYGMWGTPTPGEVASDREIDADADPASKLAAKQAEARNQVEPRSHDLGKDQPQQPQPGTQPTG